VWHNLAGLAHGWGENHTAAVLGRRGLAIRVAALGEDHLDVAADNGLRRAIRLLEPAVPADHPTLLAAREEHDQLTDEARQLAMRRLGKRDTI